MSFYFVIILTGISACDEWMGPKVHFFQSFCSKYKQNILCKSWLGGVKKFLDGLVLWQLIDIHDITRLTDSLCIVLFFLHSMSKVIYFKRPISTTRHFAITVRVSCGGLGIKDINVIVSNHKYWVCIQGCSGLDFGPDLIHYVLFSIWMSIIRTVPIPKFELISCSGSNFRQQSSHQICP